MIWGTSLENESSRRLLRNNLDNEYSTKWFLKKTCTKLSKELVKKKV